MIGRRRYRAPNARAGSSQSWRLCLHILRTNGFASSRPVAIANRIVARTASKFGDQSLLSDADFPPR
jgi:hypothetical protein